MDIFPQNRSIGCMLRFKRLCYFEDAIFFCNFFPKPLYDLL